jgi:PAS domain S-box-containing protein
VRLAALLLAGLAVLAALALWTWQAVSTDLAQIRALSQMYGNVRALGVGVTDLMLERGDVALLRELHTNAQQLAERLARDRHPQAAQGARHLHEIAAVLQSLDVPRSARTAAQDAPSLHAALRARSAELRADEAAVHKVMDTLLASRHDAVDRALLRGLGLLLAASLLFVSLALLGSWRRRGPARAARDTGRPRPADAPPTHSDASRNGDAHAAQRARERTLHLQAGALQATANGIIITGRDGVIEWVNPAFCAGSGYSFAEAVGQRPRDLVGSGAQGDDFYAHLWHTISAGEVWHGELTNRCKDGTLVTVEMSITPLRVDGEAITHFVAVQQDVSERKRAEQHIAAQAVALAEREERLRYLARATVDTVRDWDLTSDRVWWNDGLQSQFDYAPSDIEPDSRSWTARLHPDEAAPLRAGLDAALASDRDTWEAHYRFRRADGSYARVVDRAFIIRDGSGHALRIVGGMTDITARLELEERLHRAQRLESVGQLTGGVAHDFNNLLTVIQGNAELLNEELAGDPRRRALAGMITTAARRGAELTRRLLAFARKQTLEPRTVDVNAMLVDTRELLARSLGEQVEMELKPHPELWPALVDPTQLESALMNLCLNARDAMPGGGTLTIESDHAELDADYAAIHDEVEPGEYVRVTVSDTGEGMTPAVVARVFEPFFSTKRGKGTGLGLPMVYGFLKQSGGHINIYSEPGQGTTVRMYLPRAEGSAPQPVAEAAGEDASHGGAETILLVEDDELVRGYVLGQLHALGYDVREAENGPGALELLRQSDDVDLLFTDIVMPGGMNGRELADAARALCPGLRVLFTSGYTDNAIVRHGILDPGVVLLAKPYRRADLAFKIRQALSRQAR